MHLWKRYIALSLLIIMIFMLCACSSYVGIENNMVKSGFEQADNSSTEVQTVEAAVKSLQLDCIVHIFAKEYEGTLAPVTSYAIILEFDNKKELQKAVDEKINNSAALSVFFGNSDIEKFIKGNCILIPVPIGTFAVSTSQILDDIIEAFGK